MQAYLPENILCSCCKPGREKKTFVKSYKKLLKEISVTTMLKTIRVLKARAKENKTNEDWKESKLKFTYKAYEDEDKEDKDKTGSAPDKSL